MTPLEAYDLIQGSPEWAQARVGLVTASRCGDVVSLTKKGEETAKRAAYRFELICERLTGQPYPHFVTAEMAWGADQEQYARAAYELENDVLVETCGFVLHPDIDKFGASPDGLVGENGLIQIKCPTTATHLTWLLAGTVPLEHMPQMLAELSCTGRDWCDFVSFDPRLPAHLQLFIRRFEPDQNKIFMLESEVVHFNSELDQVIAALPRKQPITDVLDWPNEDEVQL